MYILGINGGHNGTAALLKNGEIVGCVSEERFSRIKNHVGFPYSTIKYLLKLEKITPKEIDYIILTKNRGIKIEKEGKPFDVFLFSYSNKGIFKNLIGYFIYKYPLIFNRAIDIKHKIHDNRKQRKRERDDVRILSKYLNIDRKKIIYTDHHLLHTFSTIANLPKNKKSLIFTLDAEGLSKRDENLCATVSIFDGKNVRRISETTKSASLGYLYGISTLYLGMKPNEHEFKVMGLAPYAKRENVNKLNPLFKEALWLDGLEFRSKFRMQYADFYLKEKAVYKRFDNLAGAIQKLTEELTIQWIGNAIKKTKINSIALSGGVFMNVKANQKISELDEVKEIFPMPSCGDECTAIGACFYGYHKYCYNKKEKFNPQPLTHLYLGPEYSDKEIGSFLRENNHFKKYQIKKFRDIEKEIARLLSKNEIVARFKGKSEWGARALGNRSILANPSSRESVVILNELIKDRDFWMPFTPSILEENLSEYIINPKKIKCPYMIITFDSTKKAKKEIIAAIHPYDLTARPQAVNKRDNPDYYKLIKEFKRLTKVGAILNTSFNLHGEPNVLSPRDAMHTFENSGLKYLAIGEYLVKK